MQGQNIFVEKNCEICNKIIFPTSMRVYKIKEPFKRTKYYCSWTCYNKGKEEHYKSKSNTRKSFRWRNG